MKPTASELKDVHSALVKQLPNLAPSWWRRVKKAMKDADIDSMKMLMVEAKNRMEHDKRRQGMSILRSILRLLGVNPEDIL